MSNHLVFKSFFVGKTRWPWKFVYNPNIGANGMWYGYAGEVKDGIRVGWQLHCEYSSYDGLKDCVRYAQDEAEACMLELMERKYDAQ